MSHSLYDSHIFSYFTMENTSGFTKLPAELRQMIWEFSLPDPRILHVLVYRSKQQKMELLHRRSLKVPIAGVCSESREVVERAGYKLHFGVEKNHEDPGVWYNPKKDSLEWTMWHRGEAIRLC